VQIKTWSDTNIKNRPVTKTQVKNLPATPNGDALDGGTDDGDALKKLQESKDQSPKKLQISSSKGEIAI
jgi:hypothetical protein